VSQIFPSAFTNLFDECEGISSPKKEGAFARDACREHLILVHKKPLFILFVAASEHVFSFIEKHFGSEKKPQVTLLFLESKNSSSMQRTYHAYCTIIAPL
jgi:hypothetical protein